MNTDNDSPEAKTTASDAFLMWALRGFLIWFAVYLYHQGIDGFFAVTADRVQSGWLKFSFLNIPLQLMLTIVASFGIDAEAGSVRIRIAWFAAVLNIVLIAGHVVLSILTA